MLEKILLNTPADESLIDITSQVQEIVRASGVQEGMCVVFSPHTTAALTVNSGLGPATLADLIAETRRLVPTRVDFHHTYDTPADAAGHIKSTLLGCSLSLIITKGQVLLGGSQSVLFFEFDGPRSRQVWVRIQSDAG